MIGLVYLECAVAISHCVVAYQIEEQDCHKISVPLDIVLKTFWLNQFDESLALHTDKSTSVDSKVVSSSLIRTQMFSVLPLAASTGPT